jgi:hypothetical protein
MVATKTSKCLAVGCGKDIVKGHLMWMNRDAHVWVHYECNKERAVSRFNYETCFFCEEEFHGSVRKATMVCGERVYVHAQRCILPSDAKNDDSSTPIKVEGGEGRGETPKTFDAVWSRKRKVKHPVDVVNLTDV